MVCYTPAPPPRAAAPARPGLGTLSEALELFHCVDQLDMTNLTGAESLIRVLQFTEHEIQKKGEGKKVKDGSEWFLARPRRLGHALICPALSEWAAARASRESAVAKEIRKANEERVLAAKK